MKKILSSNLSKFRIIKSVIDKTQADQCSISGAEHFNTISHDELYLNGLSPETKQLGEVVVNNHKKDVRSFLRNLDEMVSEYYHSNLETQHSETHHPSKTPSSDRKPSRDTNISHHEQLKIEQLPTASIPYLSIRPFHTKISNSNRLGILQNILAFVTISYRYL